MCSINKLSNEQVILLILIKKGLNYDLAELIIQQSILSNNLLRDIENKGLKSLKKNEFFMNNFLNNKAIIDNWKKWNLLGRPRSGWGILCNKPTKPTPKDLNNLAYSRPWFIN